MNHEIARAEKKHTVLQLARRFSPKKIAGIVGIEEGEVNSLIKEALTDVEERNEELGKAVMYLELERIEEVKRMMMRFIVELEEKVDASGGEITEESEKAFDMIMKAADRMDKYLTRTSKLLGLDAPVKLQATDDRQAPEKVLQAAFDEGSPVETATFDVADL